MSSIDYSIIIPTYNRGDILLDAMQSAMQQLPARAEIIVVNDGAGLSQSCKHFIVKSDIVYLETRGATGAGAARNLGAAVAKGNWLFFQDDDDMIAPNYWGSVAEHIKKICVKHDAVYGFCKSKSFSDRVDLKKCYARNEFSYHFNEVASASLKSKLAGLGVGFWVSKKVFIDVGGISETIKVNEDTDFCLRLLKVGSSCYKSSEVGALIFSGSHSNGVSLSTTKSSNAFLRMSYFAEIISDHADILINDKNTTYWLFKRYTKMAARAHSFDSLKFICQSPLLRFSDQVLLLVYFSIQGLIALTKK